MGVPGVAFILAIIVGVGYAAYQIYNQPDRQTYNTYYSPPPPPSEPPQTHNKRQRRLVRLKNGDVCSICHDPFKDQFNVTLECMHMFHRACIERWHQEQKTCPLCRASQRH